MGWRTVYVEMADKMFLRNNNLILKEESDEVFELEIPLSDISVLIIDNPIMNISLPLLKKLLEFNIDPIICGYDHQPLGIFIPFSGRTNEYSLQKKQLEWSQELKDIFIQHNIKAKIHNQICIAQKYNVDEDKILMMKAYKENVELGDSKNCEGIVARTYYRCIFGKNFKRFEDDNINAMLNFGYQIIRAMISKVLVSKGLNTRFGFQHIGDDNVFNLSDDIIEPFRPLIDDYVIQNLENILNTYTKSELIQLTTEKYFYNFRKDTLLHIIEKHIDNILDFCETKDVSKLIFPDFEVFFT